MVSCDFVCRPPYSAGCHDDARIPIRWNYFPLSAHLTQFARFIRHFVISRAQLSLAIGVFVVVVVSFSIVRVHCVCVCVCGRWWKISSYVWHGTHVYLSLNVIPFLWLCEWFKRNKIDKKPRERNNARMPSLVMWTLNISRRCCCYCNYCPFALFVILLEEPHRETRHIYEQIDSNGYSPNRYANNLNIVGWKLFYCMLD